MNHTSTDPVKTTITCSLKQIEEGVHECGRLANEALKEVEEEAKKAMVRKVEKVLLVVAIGVTAICLIVWMLFWLIKKLIKKGKTKYGQVL